MPEPVITDSTALPELSGWFWKAHFVLFIVSTVWNLFGADSAIRRVITDMALFGFFPFCMTFRRVFRVGRVGRVLFRTFAGLVIFAASSRTWLLFEIFLDPAARPDVPGLIDWIQFILIWYLIPGYAAFILTFQSRLFRRVQVARTDE